MILKFDSIKDMLSYRKKCPICDGYLKCELFMQELSLPYSKEKKEVFATFDSMTTEIVDIKKMKVKLDISNNKFLSKKKDNIFIDMRFFLFCEKETIGREYEAFGHINSYDSDIKNVFDYNNPDNDCNNYIVSGNIVWEKCVVYNIAENLKEGNLIKVINNYEKEVTGMDLSEISLDGSYEPRFQAFQRKLIDIDTFKFHEPQKIFTRINTFLLLK